MASKKSHEGAHDHSGKLELAVSLHCATDTHGAFAKWNHARRSWCCEHASASARGDDWGCDE